jgi:hypothetical protein
MRIISLTVTIALLAGCSAEPVGWGAETVLVLVPAAPTIRAKARDCAPLEPEIAVEAERTVPLDAPRAGGIDALSAALMAAEARKNARLRQAALAYERCRQAHS